MNRRPLLGTHDLVESHRVDRMLRTAILIASVLALMSCSSPVGQSLNVLGERLTVQGNSMAPTIAAGTTVVIQKSGEYRRGDIVALESPPDRRVVFVRRIVGLPGETLEVKAGKVVINGTALDEQYVSEPGSYTVPPITLPPDQYYVLADNRNAPGDSRTWGPVPAEMIRGVAKR